MTYDQTLLNKLSLNIINITVPFELSPKALQAVKDEK